MFGMAPALSSTWLRTLGNHLCLHHSLFWYWECTWRWSSRAAAGWSTSFQQTFHIIQFCPCQEKKRVQITQQPLFHWFVILPWLNHSVPLTCVSIKLYFLGVPLNNKASGPLSGTKYNYILARAPSNIQHASLFRKGRQMNVLNRQKELHAAFCPHEDWTPETLQTYPEQQHPLSYTWSPWNESHSTYICQREMHSAIGLVFHSLENEKADHEYGVRCICALGWEWIFRLNWILPFLLSMFHLAVLLLDLSCTYSPMWTGCKLLWVIFRFGVPSCHI